jgi:hypothetical protein
MNSFDDEVKAMGRLHGRINEDSNQLTKDIQKVGCFVKLMSTNRKLQAHHGKQLFEQV